MAIREIVVVGDPLLHKKLPNMMVGQEKIISEVVKDLLDTMRFLGKDCAGLAANQIGSKARICVLRSGDVFINPQITIRLGNRLASVESCYSIPGYKAVIPRHTQLNLLYTDEKGKTKFVHTSEPKFSVVIQHEVDHLDGILISDYVDGSHDKKGGVLIEQYDGDSPTAKGYIAQQLLFHMKTETTT